MPRPLAFGNGRLLIQLDREHAIRDFFWPHVGKWNHLQGYRIRLGVWVDGHLAWVDGDGWIREQAYEPGTLIGNSVLTHEALGIRLTVTEAIHPHKDWFARQIQVENLVAQEREIRLFSTHDFRIEENDIGDTAFVDAHQGAMVHYKFGTNIRISAIADHSPSIYEFTCGIKAFGHMEGTWRDAEDGHLQGIPIAQGSVDSTFSIRLEIPGNEKAFAGILIEASKEHFSNTSPIRNQRDLDETFDASRTWYRENLATSEPPSWADLTNAQKEFFYHSRFMIETQCNHNGGILAANDSDILETNRATYSCVWPRDGALVAMVMGGEILDRWCDFCLTILNKSRDGAVFDQKYSADGEIAASWHPVLKDGKLISAHQEDELNLTVMALFDQENLEYWEAMRESVFAYYERFTSSDGLPVPSYDLWEERLGVHCYTIASRIAAFKVIAELEDRAGRSGSEFLGKAAELKELFLREFYDHGLKRFIRMICPDGHRDLTPDSATLSVGLFWAIDPHSEEFRNTVAAVERDLRIHGQIDGIARYAKDYYFRRTEDYPGNPWIICTMWLAQARIALATDLDELGHAKFWLDWAIARAETTGVLAEQFHPETGEPLSVSPLTWSHAEYCRTVQDYISRYLDLRNR